MLIKKHPAMVQTGLAGKRIRSEMLHQSSPSFMLSISTVPRQPAETRTGSPNGSSVYESNRRSLSSSRLSLIAC